MARVTTEIEVEHKKRPCTITGKNYGDPDVRAWFHRWFYKETLLLHNTSRLMKTEDAKKHKKAVMDVGVIPIGEEPVITNELLALVEYETGQMAFVDPLRICFLDTKRVEDEYYILHNEEPKTCANCGWYVDDWGCNIDSVIAKTNPNGDCPNWCPRDTYPEKDCDIECK